LERPPCLVVDPDRLLQLPTRRPGALSALDPLGVEKRDGADHRDRDRQVDRGHSVGDLGQIERDDRCVEDVLAGRGGPVEHAPKGTVAEPLQRERDFAQLGLDVVCGRAETFGERGARGTKLLDDVGNADLRPVLPTVRLFERGGQADRLGLAERPSEHRAGNRLEQPFPQLAPPDPREGVQAGSTARCEPQDRPAECGDERVVLALEIDDLSATTEYPGAHQPRLRQARLSKVGPPDHQRVRVVQDPS
jgi:hypothetical protein